MKTLSDKIKEIQDQLMEESIVDGIIIVPVLDIPMQADGLILEKKDMFSQIPGTRYSFRKDKPRGIPGPGNQQHIHIFAAGNKELFAINIDGTAHDDSHGAKIPKDVATFLKSSGFSVPDNRIIEWYGDRTAKSDRTILFD